HVKPSDLTLPAAKEKSIDVAARVGAARARQRARYLDLGMPHVRSNAQADGEILERIARPDQSGLALLSEAADAMNLSARGYHRVLRVARTLADLEGREAVARLDVAEALSYRQRLAAFEAAA
ncbi:MAG TPA: ATP-binding protein, partial [Aestuariivirgaceae bacterium]|nr:ATP-binding protein [Aestuariivirgaceae bacterium]